MSRRRKVGDIMLDMEELLYELVEKHDMQWYEILALVFGWLTTHAPDAQETYMDDSHPVFFYGHKDRLK